MSFKYMDKDITAAVPINDTSTKTKEVWSAAKSNSEISKINNKIGDQVTYALSGSTLTITSK